jgi:putative endonuclease
MAAYYVYILTNKYQGVLYVGVTNDIARRVRQHKNKINEWFTNKYKVNSLVYYEKWWCVVEAIQREKQLKKRKRSWKMRLIEEDNKYWEDLSKMFWDVIER